MCFSSYFAIDNARGNYILIFGWGERVKTSRAEGLADHLKCVHEGGGGGGRG